jgi:phenylalanyl-tRNA synthetase beta chain
MTKVYVRPETALVRPFIVCAILRGVTFTKERYDSFIDLQDKLHQNLCRQRSLVAIGTHDLSTVKGPFTYEALPPTDIEFIPLKQQKKYNAKDLLDYYLSNDQKLKRYVPLIQSSLVYPVVMDSERNILSLPPIINGAKSAITLDTKDIFIECTATDLTKAKIVLNTVCAMFSEYCSTPFEIEPVEVIDSRGSSTIYPDVGMKKFDVKIDYVNMCTGLKLTPGCAIDLLKKMQLEAEAKDDSSLTVRVPITRSDVLHSCDIMEDVAISYGYNNLPIELPMTSTVGKENPLAQICELLRVECATSGFTEVLTWALCSRKEIFDDLRLDEQENKAVSIGNPATVEFEVCRTTLLPGVLKTLGRSCSSSHCRGDA